MLHPTPPRSLSLRLARCALMVVMPLLFALVTFGADCCGDAGCVPNDSASCNVFPPAGDPALCGLNQLPLRADFDDDDEGWRVVEGPFTGPTAPAHIAEGGSIGGAVTAEGHGQWYWQAPECFIGSRACYFGRDLCFDLNHSIDGGCRDGTRLVVLSSGEASIHVDAPHEVAQTWTSFRFALDETGGWVHSDTGVAATDAEILAILAGLTDLRIRGWTFSCGIDGAGGLDNVAVGASRTDPPLLAGPEVASTFDADADGWQVAGGSFGPLGIHAHSVEGGIPGGHIHATGSGNWYWIAPASFRGNAEAAYGHYLKFDLNHSEDGGCRDDSKLVILNGGGDAIYMDAPYLPQQAWTSYSIRLHETELWRRLSDGMRPTKEQLLAILRDLRQIHIRGWTFNCGIVGTGGLDNVRLQLADPADAPLSGNIASSFEDGDDGWIVAGGDFGRLGITSIADAGGNPGSFLGATGSGPWYWIAPPKFYGDAVSAYGKALTLDLNVSDDGGCSDDTYLAYLEGGGYSIYFHPIILPSPVWTSYVLPLDETALWYHTGTTDRVTGEQLRRLLADLSRIRIRGWYRHCGISGTGGIDNVVLDAGD